MSLAHERELQSLQNLQQYLTGTLILPQHASYEQARRIWNGRIDKRPVAIVQCASEQDVIIAVNFARDNNYPLSVRGGGHDYGGRAICEGIVIDFSQMRTVTVDPVNCTARAQAGAKVEDLIGASSQYGLATATGSLSMVGIAGLTLGGGFGPLAGKYGLVLDNLISANIVTANGELLTASTVENPELFWGIRGGSGNFGVVTSFQYRLYPLTDVLTSTVIYPLDQAKEVLRFYSDVASTAPDELTIGCVIMTLPDGPTALLLAPCYSGDDFEEGARLLEPLRTFGTPIANAMQPVAYKDHLAFFNSMIPDGRSYQYKGQSFTGLSDAVIDTLIEAAQTMTAPVSALIFHHIHGAASRVPAEETAFSQRYDHLMLEIFVGWDHLNPADDQRHLDWVSTVSEKLAPHALPAVYVNMLDDSEHARVPLAYGANYQRLRELKAQYDPQNLFSSNNNITPE